MAATDSPQPLPRLDDIPIPENIQPSKGWTEQMVEMADHIGAYATMQIVAHFGGQLKYIPIDASRNPFREVIGPAKAEIVSHVYGPTKFQVPTARYALRVARRGGVLRLVRRREMTARDAAIILGTSRTYLTYLLNHADEDAEPPAILPRRVPKIDPRQIDIFTILNDSPPVDIS